MIPKRSKKPLTKKVSPKRGIRPKLIAKPALTNQALLRRVMLKRKRPISIMFVCTHGLSSSIIAKEWFSDFLEKQGVSKYFKFSTNDEYFSRTPKKPLVDYIVPIFPKTEMDPRYVETIGQKRLLNSINLGKTIILKDNPLINLGAKATLKQSHSRLLRQILLIEQKK